MAISTPEIDKSDWDECIKCHQKFWMLSHLEDSTPDDPKKACCGCRRDVCITLMKGLITSDELLSTVVDKNLSRL